MTTSLFQERKNPGPGGKDKVTVWIARASLWGIAATALVDPYGFNPAWRIGGVVGFIGGAGLAAWAIHSNRWFSSVVRIQTDREHILVCKGPYSWVRHPGYLGFMVAYWYGCIALNSPLALVIAAFYCCAIIRRTRLEDAFLKENLDNYKKYSTLVRYKLIPFVW